MMISSSTDMTIDMQPHEKSSQLTWLHRQLIEICKTGGVPKHVAFVMDGNRRFARTHKLGNVLVGHEKGFESLLYSLEVCLALGVEIVTVYAFSEENFSRPSTEVDGLMKLACDKFTEFLKVEEIVMREGVIVDMLGRTEILPSEVRTAAAKVVVGTRNNKGAARLNVCFAYSGTEETSHAMRRVARGLLSGELTVADVNADLISKCTYLGSMPPPDLLIRTSGETRLSDFLLWHMKTTKMVFIDVLWPELTIWHLLTCVIDWQTSRKSSAQEDKDQPECNVRVTNFLHRVEAERMARWQQYL